MLLLLQPCIDWNYDSLGGVHDVSHDMIMFLNSLYGHRGWWLSLMLFLCGCYGELDYCLTWFLLHIVSFFVMVSIDGCMVALCWHIVVVAKGCLMWCVSLNDVWWYVLLSTIDMRALDDYLFAPFLAMYRSRLQCLWFSSYYHIG